MMQYKVANSFVRNGILYQMRCWTPQEKSIYPPPYSKSESVNLRNVGPYGALPASLKNSGTEPAPKTGAALGASKGATKVYRFSESGLLAVSVGSL